ncbi:Coatomer subunit gamma, partial [Fragariocoptes setiger]
MRRDKKDESWEETIDKTTAIQEARQFNQTSVDVRKCSFIMTKIIYIIMQGERLSQEEATDTFFNMTKLFQSRDTTLRRLVYIGIKELSKQAENVYVVTSSLTSGVNSSGDDPAIRASALRALCQITDVTTFQGIERYLKQAIVDKHPVLASAALVSSLRLSSTVPHGLTRWANEIQEALNSNSPMVQYHALGLLYTIRKNDRLAVSKLIAKCVKNGIKSPLALCLLIRLINRFINDQNLNNDEANHYYDFIKSCLKNRSDMVVYEAANALVNLKSSNALDLDSPVQALHVYLTNQKATLRFAAVRALNRVATTHPGVVSRFNLDLETLITQSETNRSIATLAITTLLKTGNENSIERLLSQIGGFLPEIDDEFKVVVVASIRQLCQKYPGKHHIMMDFLSKMLHEEGGYKYKKSIVETLVNIIEDNEDTRDDGLMHLCDFIEDCEHPDLAVKILGFLGQEGPKTKRPSRYVRFINNRIYLDKPIVQAAAVSALAKFGCSEKDHQNLLVLLDRISASKEDEVRDRAVFSKSILEFGDKGLNSQFISDPTVQVSIRDLELQLLNYVSNKDLHCTPFDIKTVAPTHCEITGRDSYQDRLLSDNDVENDDESTLSYNEVIQNVDELKELNLGPLQKSSPPILLTERDTEFVVECVKHVFQNHILFQFNCSHTMRDHQLQNISVDMLTPECLKIVASVECPDLIVDTTMPIYVCAEILDYEPGVCTNVNLRYTARMVDTDTGDVMEDAEYDEYPLENIVVEVDDYPQ